MSVFELNESEPVASKFHQKGAVCNAGFSVGIVKSDGIMKPCYYIQNKMGHIYTKIKFSKYLAKCPEKFCGCPFNKYDPYLFDTSVKEAKGVVRYPFKGRFIYSSLNFYGDIYRFFTKFEEKRKQKLANKK